MQSSPASAALSSRSRRGPGTSPFFAGLAALFLIATAIGCGRASTEVVDEPAVDVAIGSTIADLGFVDGRGSPRHLSDVARGRPLVVAFTVVGCPLAARYLPVLADLERDYRERGVAFLALDVGAAMPVEAVSQALDAGAEFPFGKDLDGSVAAALGATRSPQVVLLDAGGVLRYRGRIDDRFRFSGTRPRASREDLRQAIEDVLAGRAVAVPRTQTDGCPLEPQSIPADPTLTWSDHVAPIVERRCTPCHHADGGAPFALVDLADVRRRRGIIEEVIEMGRMPPWFAAPPVHGRFLNDISLSPEERATLLGWLRGDLVEGPPVGPLTAPQRAWSIGEPDLVLETKPVQIPASGYIDYHYTSLDHEFLRETWIEAIELHADEPRLVHHAVIAAVDRHAADDDMESLVSWGRPVFVYAPGRPKLELDTGTALRVPPGSALMLQVHYVTDGRARPDRIRVGIRFPRADVDRQIRAMVIQDMDMVVPAHHPAFAVSSDVSAEPPVPVRLHSAFAHMHLRGRDVNLTARLPDGTTETLLRVPAYHFDWQVAYEFPKDRPVLPPGTVITYTSRYDNSAYNELNPDPERVVPAGQSTTDEMHYAWVLYTIDGERLGIPVDPATGARRGPPPLGRPAGFDWRSRR